MLKLRSFWLEHKEDTLVVLLLIILFIGLFFLLSYLFLESFDQPTSRLARSSSTGYGPF